MIITHNLARAIRKAVLVHIEAAPRRNSWRWELRPGLRTGQRRDAGTPHETYNTLELQPGHDLSDNSLTLVDLVGHHIGNQHDGIELDLYVYERECPGVEADLVGDAVVYIGEDGRAVVEDVNV